MGGDASMGMSRKGVEGQEKEFRRGLEGWHWDVFRRQTPPDKVSYSAIPPYPNYPVRVHP